MVKASYNAIITAGQFSFNYILHKKYALDKIEKITLKKNVNIQSVSKAGLNVCFKNPYLPSVT